MPRQNLIALRLGDTAGWAGVNPVLDAGEPGFDAEAGVLKIGDGVSTFTQLPALTTGSVGDVSSVDGRSGAVTLSDIYAALSHTHTSTDITDLGTAATQPSSAFATSAQGSLADSALQSGDVATVALTGAYADLISTPDLVAPLNGVTGLWIGTETEYAAISSPSATVVYVVVED